MSDFKATIAKAINDYRALLRKHLPQDERVNRLNKLELRHRQGYGDDVNHYRLAQNVIRDIEENMLDIGSGNSYYAYSGVETFKKYLKEYVNMHAVIDGRVVNKTQHASRAMLQAIQLITLPENRLSELIMQKLIECNETIAQYGSEEQKTLHRKTLLQRKLQNKDFYQPVLQNFEEQVLEAA